MSQGNGAGQERTVTVTGGAGFVGTNLADRLASGGDRVIVYDDLSRPGVEKNLRWLKNRHPDRIEAELGGITEARRLGRVVGRSDAVFHLAAQVAVTTSIREPERDFSVNARGTLNLLEAVRRQDDPPPVVFSSTNKVYGRLAGVRLEEGDRTYLPVSRTHREGVSETQSLSFHSPYGCSKGAAEQYVLDYARTYGISATVFRMSCVYGPHQHGTEEQGWVGHFLLRALRGEPITIFGDGKQVRDILWISDLVDAFMLALDKVSEVCCGRVFNLGGGPTNAVSLLELVDELARLCGREPRLIFADWREGDQRWYVSDTEAFRKATGWEARTSKAEGLRRLHQWLSRRRGLPPAGAAAATAAG